MGQRISRLLHPCSANMFSKRSCWSVSAATKKDHVAALFFVVLICSVGANACKPEQILWKSAAGKPGQCLDCPTCPPGSQPSVPYGTTIKNWTAMHCVPCQLGKTYSDKFDKGQCKACTICSTGKGVIQNCTRLSKTECSTECKTGYYHAPFSFACRPCSECCGDEKDEVARECRNFKHKCKVRPTRCNHAQTTPLKTTTPSYNTASTVSTAQMIVPKKSEMTTTQPNKEEKRVPYDELKSSMKPTLSAEVLTGKAEESGNQGGTNEAVILSVIIVFPALTVMSCLCILALVFKKNFDKLRDMLRPSREVDSKNSDNNISQSRQRSESSQSASQSSRSASLLLNLAESSQNYPSTLHQHNGLAPNLPNESTLPQSGGSSSPPPVKPPESSLPSRSEASHPIQSGSSQSESIQSSESTLLLHNRAESSQTNGNALSQTKGSVEASHANRSESSQSDRYTPSPVTSGCGASSQPDGSESPHSNQCESVELNPLSVFPLPSPCQSPQYSGYATSQPTGSDWSANDQYEFKPGDVTLEKLEENHLEAFDLMCKRLDIRRGNARWDFERLAFCYNIPLITRDSLKNEFQNDHGSPSRALMVHLKTQHPNLPLRHLIKKFESIGRNDIAQELIPYTIQNVDCSSAQGASPRLLI